jgi:hypothetical protein
MTLLDRWQQQIRHRWRARFGVQERTLLVIGDEQVFAMRWSLAQPLHMLSLACVPASATWCADLKAQGYLKGDVTLMLSARQRAVTILPRPAVADAELVDAVRWQLQDAFSFAPEAAMLDVLTMDDDKPIDRQQVMVFAIEKTELAQLLKPLLQSKAPVQCVDVPDCAQRNMVRRVCGETRTVACLAYQDGAVLLTVSRGADLLFSRLFDNLNLERLTDEADRVALQIQRSFDFLERRSADAAPVELVVGPARAQDADDRDFLLVCATLTGMRVRRPNWFEGFDAPEGGWAEHGVALFHLLGVALRDQPVAVADVVAAT